MTRQVDKLRPMTVRERLRTILLSHLRGQTALTVPELHKITDIPPSVIASEIELMHAEGIVEHKPISAGGCTISAFRRVPRKPKPPIGGGA